MFNPIRLSRATTIRPENGIRQINSRLDPRSVQRMDDLIDYYTELTGLKTNSGTIVRRAVRLLRDQLEALNPDQENQIIRQCGEGKEPVFSGGRS
ncbi:hypothetical protein [uncultured Desulfobacter sp.]|uniref:hypothetical protein n=1 Tax=uncultured Desulfobacter sp. TaxID=240139 RepID=UPI0029F5AFA5|nr:hypothetical protein [uncultured Desulfobacter sp.]